MHNHRLLFKFFIPYSHPKNIENRRNGTYIENLQNIQRNRKMAKGGEAPPLVKRKKCQEIINLEHLLTKTIK
jgi:hypothetical protein